MTPWLLAFLLTQLVEAPVYAYALRARSGEATEPWVRLGLLGLIPSAITHPVVWFAFPYFMESCDYWTMVAAAEGFAVLVEFLVLRRMRLPRAILWSLFANATSLGIGFLVRETTGLV